jgi:hypothetical protein
MRLGVVGVALAGLMVLVGFATIIAAVRRHSAPGMSTEALFALNHKWQGARVTKNLRVAGIESEVSCEP